MKTSSDEFKTIGSSFIDWKKTLKSENRGGKLMFDVPKYYKWIEEHDLFRYYVDFVWKNHPIGKR